MPTGFTPFQRKFGKKTCFDPEWNTYLLHIYFYKNFGDVFELQSKNVKNGSQKFIENNMKNVKSSQSNSYEGEELLF